MPLQRLAVNRCVDELDGVDYWRCLALASEGGLELKETAGVAGGDDFGVERSDELGFAVAEGVGGVRLDEIVNAGGAAADGGFGDFCYLEAGNVREQLARLAANTLRVL